MKRLLVTVIVGALAATALAGCSSAASGDRVVKVAYQTFGAFTQMDTHMKAVFTDWIPNGKVAIALNTSRVLGGGSALAGAVKG